MFTIFPFTKIHTPHRKIDKKRKTEEKYGKSVDRETTLPSLISKPTDAKGRLKKEKTAGVGHCFGCKFTIDADKNSLPLTTTNSHVIFWLKPPYWCNSSELTPIATTKSTTSRSFTHMPPPMTTALIAIVVVILGWITIEIACKPCLKQVHDAFDRNFNPNYDPDDQDNNNNIRSPLNPNTNSYEDPDSICAL
ncbi:putative F-box/kelch-repeat protein [Capsicum annuum]|nr:putative F-box/kelch-repeat protein [Capsicum annuum]KAF3641850.1 putative F-box/kelch-repeat protein [Capsicum annuum]